MLSPGRDPEIQSRLSPMLGLIATMIPLGPAPAAAPAPAPAPVAPSCADLDDDGDGVKKPVADGAIADFAVVAARTGSSGRESDISLFIVDLKAAGVEVKSLTNIDLTRGQAEITFRNAKAEPLGAAGEGWSVITQVLDRAAVLTAFEQVGGADRALEMGRDYALDRIAFGRPIGSFQAVKHMLADMYVSATLARSNCYYGAWALSTNAGELPEAAAAARISATQAFQHCAKNNIQVHGGMGFVEETGAAQYLRDVRITPIYEGTNGIQAMDLVGRKMMDGGDMAFRLIDEVLDGAKAAQSAQPQLAHQVWQAAESLRDATQEMLDSDMPDRFAGAVPYLAAFARVLGAHYHLRAAVAGGSVCLARIYISRLLPHHAADLAVARAGLGDLAALDDALFSGDMAG